MLASFAASAAGAGVSIASANSAKSQMNDVMNQEIATQSNLQRKASPAFQQSLEQSAPQSAQKQMDDQTQKALAAYAATVPQTSSTGTGSGQGSAIGNPGAAVADSTANAYNTLTGRANAAAQGPSGFSLAQYLKNLQFSNTMAPIGLASSMSASNTPYLLSQAQQSGSTGMAAGQLLSSLGGLAGMYGGLQSGLASGQAAAQRAAENAAMSYNSMPY